MMNNLIAFKGQTQRQIKEATELMQAQLREEKERNKIDNKDMIKKLVLEHMETVAYGTLQPQELGALI
jgi:hypothetical protein